MSSISKVDLSVKESGQITPMKDMPDNGGGGACCCIACITCTNNG
ncbi:hypothetical protein MHI39_21285 [Heyndrickxia sp. FSL K6-6286]